MNFGILCRGRHSAFTYDVYTGDFIAMIDLIFSQNFVDEPDVNTRFTMYFEYVTSSHVSKLKIIEAIGNAAIISWTAHIEILDHLKNGDYLEISGFVTEPNNNGLWKLTDDPAANVVRAIKVDGINPVTEINGEAVVCNENPFESPGAVIVQDNNKENINASISALQISFDFDYTHNIQGGRTPNTDAAVVVVAIACDGAQYTKVYHTITRSIGQVITIDGSDELNFTN